MNDQLIKLKGWLTDAEEAYHQLLLGGGVRVIVDQNAERVEYTAANKANLWGYIQQLRAEICRLDPTDPICMCGMGRASGPMGVLF